jgi:ribonuclease BN (tRNA processing enzyme)
LTVVGCSGSFAGPDSPASCYLLQAEHEGRTYSLVVDLGNGALGALQRHIDLVDVDAVVLSHLHVDHCIDLASYYVVRTYRPGGAMPRLPVHGPAGTGARIAAASGFRDQRGVDKVFDFTDWGSDQPVRLGPFTITPARVLHPVETYALRIEEQGRVLVYSGDSGPSTALVDLASGADLFLCEASFLVGGDNPPDLHLTGREAGLHASRAGVGRLLLTHIPPWHDPARILAEAVPEFSGPVELAETDAVYTV